MKVLSLGAGVQSSTLLLMALEGELEQPDCAIFADTGFEPAHVYTQLERLEALAAQVQFPIHRVSAGNIRDDAMDRARGNASRWASMPFHITTQGQRPGMLRRQCSSEYKIKPIRTKLREIQERPKPGSVEMWLGISLDEIARMRPSSVKWITSRFPLVEKRMTRWDCIRWLDHRGYKVPNRSSCIGCPYHSRQVWADMKTTDPKSWQEAVEFDAAIRKLPGLIGECYLHRSCTPLPEVHLSGDGQMELQLWSDECEGICGT